MMSTSEEILLRPVDSKKEVDGRHTAPTEPLEKNDAPDNAQGTSSSSNEETTVQGTTSRWMTVFTTAATLLSNSILTTGISMIAPFYPIVVSCIPAASHHEQGNVLGETDTIESKSGFRKATRYSVCLIPRD